MMRLRSQGAAGPGKELDEQKVTFVGLLVIALVAGGCYLTAPALKKRLAALPVLGNVQAAKVSMAGLSNPLELPVALAVPTDGRNALTGESLGMIEEVFLPSAAAAPVLEAPVEQPDRTQEVIRETLARVRVDGASNTGVFLSGRFYAFGERIDIVFPNAAGGVVQPVLVGYHEGRAKVRVGGESHWIGMRQP